MTTEERRRRIARLLVDAGRVQVGELAIRFGVSSETVRKDLIVLDRQGLARKEHGGAVALGAGSGAAPDGAAEASLCIVEKALEYVPDSGIVIIDGGPLCKLLAQRLDALDTRSVLTDSLDIALLLLERGIKASILGGELLNESRSVGGLWACESLTRVRSEVAFLSTGSFAGRNGPCTDGFAQALVAQCMLSSAQRSFVLADGSTDRRSAPVEYAAWEEVGCLIVDSSANMESLDALMGRVDVQIAY